MLQGLEVYMVSATDTEERVRGVNRGYLWIVWILENVKGNSSFWNFIKGPMC